MQSRHFNNDELFSIAIQLDLHDLYNFCSVNNQTVQLCQKDRIWNYKLEKEFSEYTHLFNTNNTNKQKKYILLYELNKIKIAFKLTTSLDSLYNEETIRLYGTEEIPKEIPKEIEKLQNLKRFEIHGILTQIPKQLFNLHNLTQLIIRKGGITELPKEIG